MKKYPIIKFKQPAGEFAMLSMPVYELMKIAYTSKRTENSVLGIQRKINDNRINAIAKFIDTEKDNIVFPTPIILSLPYYKEEIIDETTTEITPETPQDFYELDYDNNTFEILKDNVRFAKVIDGQHRLFGIEKSKSFKTNNLELTLPVLFVIGADIWTQAYLFAKINGEQRQVPYSFVADLFDLSPNRDIQTVSHKIIKALNERQDSALNGCIKMLGIRIDEDQTLSQGTIARELQKLLGPKGVLHKYYTAKADNDLMNMFTYYFNGIKNNWTSDWYDTKGSIIRKTVGFLGFIKAFPDIFNFGLDHNNLEEKFFDNVFKAIKSYFDQNNLQLTKDYYHSNAAGASELRTDILSGFAYYKQIDNK